MGQVQSVPRFRGAFGRFTAAVIIAPRSVLYTTPFGLPSSMSSPQSPTDVHEWLKSQESTGRTIDVSIVVPAFNEERRLPPTLLDMIDFFDRQPQSYEIIVVDDGSGDGTSEVVRKFERVREQVKLIQLPKNYGKGHAVRLGILNSRGKVILFADADGATPINEFNRLYDAIHSGADIAIGSRAIASTETRVTTSIHRKLLGRIFNWCVNTVLLPSIADTQCGFKMFTRNTALFLFKRQRADRFSFDVEILYIARKANLAIKEVAINWNNIPGSKVNLLVDSMRMFRDVFQFKMRHRYVSPEHYHEFCAATNEPALGGASAF
jgi:dolichyl-phosphate beta-glucosyltransferase